jgi:hypothetical protein
VVTAAAHLLAETSQGRRAQLNFVCGFEREYRNRLRTGLRHSIAQVVELLNDLDGLEPAEPSNITIAETVDGQFCRAPG